MQKRHCIMVTTKVYKELKKIKAYLLIKQNLDIKNNGQVIEYMIEHFKEKEMNDGDKKIF